MRGLDELRKGFQSLTNQQLAKKLKSASDEHEEFISSASTSMITGSVNNNNNIEHEDEESDYERPLSTRKTGILSKIGVKPNDTMVEIPGIVRRNEEHPIPRQDGKMWELDDELAHEYFPRQWTEDQMKRIKILEDDPNYQFLELVAGHSEREIKDLIAEQQYVMLRETYLQLQQKYKLQAANSIDDLRTLLREKSQKLKQYESSRDLQTVAKDRITSNIKAFRESYKRMMALEDIVNGNVYLPLSIDDGTGVFNTYALTMAGIKFKNVGILLTKYLYKYFIGVDDELKSEFINSVIRPSGDPLIPPYFGTSTSSEVSKRIMSILKIKSLPPYDDFLSQIEMSRKSQFLRIITSMLMDEDDFASSLLMKMFEFFMANIKIDDMSWDTTSSWDDMMAFIGDIPSKSFAVPFKVELVKRRSAFFVTYERAISFYRDTNKGTYRYDSSNSTLIRFDSKVLEYISLIGEISRKVARYIDSTRGKVQADRAEDQNALLTASFDNISLYTYVSVYKASETLLGILPEYTKDNFLNENKRTTLFNSILVNTDAYIDGHMEKEYESAKKKPLKWMLFFNIVLREFLERSVVITKDQIEVTEQDIKKTEQSIDNLVNNKEKVTLSDVEYPYKQNPSWVMEPRHSGYIVFSPKLKAAIEKADAQIALLDADMKYEHGDTKYSEIEFEQLQRIDRVKSSVAELVAVFIRFPEIRFPSRYVFKGAQSEAYATLANVLADLRRFKIQKNGKKYKVSIRKKRDPLRDMS